jgi:DNA-directed RNA polymerase specialized sigma24 family protein
VTDDGDETIHRHDRHAMNETRPSGDSPDAEPPPSAIPEPDAKSVNRRLGAEAFVVSAYEANHAEIFSFLTRATRDRVVAEDLLREAYIRLAKEARDGRAPVQVRRWLYREASNLVIGVSRRERTAHGRELGGDIGPVLDGLSADARVALLLSAAGFTGDEIATALGRSTDATRTLLTRARARVRLRRALFGQDPG